MKQVDNGQSKSRRIDVRRLFDIVLSIQVPKSSKFRVGGLYTGDKSHVSGTAAGAVPISAAVERVSPRDSDKISALILLKAPQEKFSPQIFLAVEFCSPQNVAACKFAAITRFCSLLVAGPGLYKRPKPQRVKKFVKNAASLVIFPLGEKSTWIRPLAAQPYSFVKVNPNNW